MKRILILIDFSDSSINAARYAANLAATYGSCNLILCHCVSFVPVNDELNFNQGAYIEAIREEKARQLHDLKTDLQPLLKSGAGIECVLSMESVSYAAEGLAKDNRVDLVVMGTKNHNQISEFLFGSTALEMIGSFPFALLLVPGDRGYEPVKDALFACELSGAERIPAEKICSVVHHLHCKLHILNVDTHQNDRLDTDRILQQEKVHQLFEPLDPEYHYINHPDIEEGIRLFAQKQQVGLLIAIHKEHGFFYHLIHSSTSKKLATHGNMPLLVLKEEQAEEGEFYNYEGRA